jgi:hypothetical protein
LVADNSADDWQANVDKKVEPTANVSFMEVTPGHQNERKPDPEATPVPHDQPQPAPIHDQRHCESERSECFNEKSTFLADALRLETCEALTSESPFPNLVAVLPL